MDDDIQTMLSKFDITTLEGLGKIEDYKNLLICKQEAIIQQEKIYKLWIKDMKSMNQKIQDISVILENLVDNKNIDYTELISYINNTNRNILYLSNNISNVNNIVLDCEKIINDFKYIDNQVFNMKENFKTIFDKKVTNRTNVKVKSTRRVLKRNFHSFKIHDCYKKRHC